LPGDVAEEGHGKEMGQRNENPKMEGVSDEERSYETAHRSCPGFLRGNLGRERMSAERTANEVRDRVGGPGDSEGKEEQAWAAESIPMQGNSKRQRKRNEKKGARRNSSCRQGFDERSAGKER